MAYIIIRAGTQHRFELFVHQGIMAKILMTRPMNKIHLRDTADAWEHPDISPMWVVERLGSGLTFIFSEQQQHMCIVPAYSGHLCVISTLEGNVQANRLHYFGGVT